MYCHHDYLVVSVVTFLFARGTVAVSATIMKVAGFLLLCLQDCGAGLGVSEKLPQG